MALKRTRPPASCAGCHQFFRASNTTAAAARTMVIVAKKMVMSSLPPCIALVLDVVLVHRDEEARSNDGDNPHRHPELFVPALTLKPLLDGTPPAFPFGSSVPRDAHTRIRESRSPVAANY